MDNEKTPKYYIEKLVDDIEFCIKHVENLDLDEFCNDEVLTCAISFKFVQISENTKKLPTTLVNAYPDIPWNKISGLRNRIVHDYGSIQLDIVYNTIKKNLPELLESLTKLLN